MLINSEVADILFKRLFVLLCLLVIIILLIHINHAAPSVAYPEVKTNPALIELNKGDIVFASFDI